MTSITPNKMADNDMSFCQRAVIEFLAKEEIPAAEIHQTLQLAYGSVCMGASSVQRRVKHFKDGKTEAIQKAVCQCLRMTGEFSNFQNAGRNVYKEVAIMWKNKESYVD